MKKALKIMLLLTVLLVVSIAAGQFIKQLVLIPTTGEYEGELLVSPSNIDWGTINTSTPVNRMVTLTNYGANITALNMTIINISTNLLNFTVTWDAEGESLPSGWLIDATFTLTIYEALNGPFSFDVLVNDKT